MTTKDRIREMNTTRELLGLFANCQGISYFFERQMIKKKIFNIELPIIRAELESIEDFEYYMAIEEDRFTFFDIGRAICSGKKNLNKHYNQNSHYNIFRRTRYRLLYKKMLNPRPSYFIIEVLLNTMSPYERSHFERITQIDLSFFTKLKNLSKKRKK